MSAKSTYAVIIDTDPGMSLALRHMFQTICGVSAEVYPDVVAASEALSDGEKPEVIVLGRAPRRAGVISSLKSQGYPFIIVLDRGEVSYEAEEAFLAGADDVIQYPFSLKAFALRLRARVGLLASREGAEILEDSQNWDDGAYIASQAGLTSAEAQIAHVLISHSGEIVSRDELSFAIDHRPWDYGDRKFDVHVAKIRKKLTAVFGEHIAVNTVRAAGYQIKIDQQGLQRLLRA